MADVFSRTKRSAVMRAIKPRDTKPEVEFRRRLRSLGFRPASKPPKLPGTPDVVLPGLRTAIFVHGCFWHRHDGCPRTTTPAVRRDFWQAKFDANVARDRRVTRSLRRIGWRVLVVWTCRAQSPEELERVARLLNLARERVIAAAAVAERPPRRR